MQGDAKLVALRSRLDQFGFTQPFGPDSAALVQKLLLSFVKLSEVGQSHKVYQLSKKQTETLEERTKALESKVYPAEAEVARLTKENNLLHQQVIHEKQAASSAEGKLLLASKRETDLKRDLMYVANSKDSRIQALLDDNLSLKSKLEAIIKKTLDQYDTDKGGKLALELRKKVAETYSLVSEIKNDSKTLYDLVSALKKAEQDVVSAKTMLIEVECEKLGLKTEIDAKEEAVILKEREIKRLQSKTVEGGITHLQEFWNKNYSE
jgi:hypothetical protein